MVLCKADIPQPHSDGCRLPVAWRRWCNAAGRGERNRASGRGLDNHNTRR